MSAAAGTGQVQARYRCSSPVVADQGPVIQTRCSPEQSKRSTIDTVAGSGITLLFTPLHTRLTSALSKSQWSSKQSWSTLCSSKSRCFWTLLDPASAPHQLSARGPPGPTSPNAPRQITCHCAVSRGEASARAGGAALRRGGPRAGDTRQDVNTWHISAQLVPFMLRL